jgi:hypothetical protein
MMNENEDLLLLLAGEGWDGGKVRVVACPLLASGRMRAAHPIDAKISLERLPA